MKDRMGVRILREPRPGYWFVKVTGSRRIIACKSPAKLAIYIRARGMRWDNAAPTDYNRY